MLKKTLCYILLNIFVSIPVFCDSWFVCLGSFKEQKNAEKFVSLLKSENIQASIYLHKKDSGTFYRVLLDQKFDFINEARNKRNEINNHPFIKNLNLSGLWACSASPEDIFNNTVILTSNEDIPISPEKPYSILVRSYKEEQAAVNDKERLAKNDIDAYVLKTFDDSSYFSFNLHTGAFKDEKDGLDLQNKLADLGIEDTKISNYEDIVDDIEKYNEMIENNEISYDTGSYTIPSSFSPWIKKCITQFPINKDFQIEEIMLFDIDNINATKSEVEDLDFIKDTYLEETENIHAVSLAKYKDDLFNNEVSVFIAVGDNGTFVPKETENTDKIQFAIVNDVLDCTISKNDSTDYYLYGINPSQNMFVAMISKDFDENQFMAFINNISNDSNLLVYPQLRKNLLVLPEKNDSVQRDFLYFTLSKVGDDYARERGYSNWSVPIVGHWRAASYFYQNDNRFSLAFFDMDYDYNASRIHNMFMSEKKNIDINENNHPSTLEDTNSWYINLLDSNELSFSTKSYIIAVGSENNLSENDLIDTSRELQIWD